MKSMSKWVVGAVVALCVVGWSGLVAVVLIDKIPLRYELWRARNDNSGDRERRIASRRSVKELSAFARNSNGFCLATEAEKQAIGVCLLVSIMNGNETQESIDTLEFMMYSRQSSTLVSASAVLQLADCGNAEAQRVLAEALVDLKRIHVPAVAVRAFRDSRYESVVPYLIAMMKTNPQYARHASWALKDYTGLDLPVDFEVWNAWYKQSEAHEQSSITPEMLIESQTSRKAERQERLGILDWH